MNAEARAAYNATRIGTPPASEREAFDAMAHHPHDQDGSFACCERAAALLDDERDFDGPELGGEG